MNCILVPLFLAAFYIFLLVSAAFVSSFPPFLSLSLAILPSPPFRPLDEVIRQVAVSSGERGLLLLRVRDEIRMVMSSYQTLYESSIAFGMRKALLADQKKRELQARVSGGYRIGL